MKLPELKAIGDAAREYRDETLDAIKNETFGSYPPNAVAGWASEDFIAGAIRVLARVQAGSASDE